MSAPRRCSTCGQALPAEVRRDPPLPPLETPVVRTIHDLPPGTTYEVIHDGQGTARRLKL